MTDARVYPSIVQQTKWNCGKFDFGKQDGYAFFNCGIVERPDGLWLIARRSKNDRRFRVGFNDMIAAKLDESNYRIIGSLPIVTKHHFEKEHFEDPRAIYHDGTTYISACNFLIVNNGMGWTGAHQTMNAIRSINSNRFWQVDHRYDPIFGYNGERIGKDTGPEKNWLWFFHNGIPHLVYKAFPHTVSQFSKDFVFQREFKTGEENPPRWDYGIIRGGTPPIKVGDEYITFFHSSLPLDSTFHRRYYMGAYAFQAFEPFKITRMTDEPILAGSALDKWNKGKPLVVFPCGSRLKNEKWLVTFGVNDLESAWIEIPHAELEDRLIPLDGIKKKWTKTFIKPRLELPDVTLVCVDDKKPEAAKWAVDQCQKHCKFADVLTFSSNNLNAPIKNLEDYSEFIVKGLLPHIKTSHVLVCQWDGYVTNPELWSPEFLDYDYIGAMWAWRNENKVGNGGFSLRSRKLLEVLSGDEFNGPFLPEDEYICQINRGVLEKKHGILFAPESIACKFSNEYRLVGQDSFGFHNFLTVLPKSVLRPKVFHHSGDLGDIIYGMAAMASVGGGVIFLSPNGIGDTRQKMSPKVFENIEPLLAEQPYVWRACFTNLKVQSSDYDLNEFRKVIPVEPRNFSLFQMHQKAARSNWPEDRPWLVVKNQVIISEKPIVINRSQRYLNNDFPWLKLVKKYGSNMSFIGSRNEHIDFIKRFGDVDYFPTENLLEAARIISGAKVFIGNQSCCMAIALGLGKNVIQETWDGDNLELGIVNTKWDGKGWPNCVLERDNAIYVRGNQAVDIPRKWLKGA